MVRVHRLAFVVRTWVTLPRNDLGRFVGLEAPGQAVMERGACVVAQGPQTEHEVIVRLEILRINAQHPL